MEIYTPIVAIVMYIATLLAPAGTNELTFASEGEVTTFVKEGDTWSQKDGKPGSITITEQYIIERHSDSPEHGEKQLLSDYIAMPVDLAKGEIDLKRAPVKIEFEKKEELVVSTLTSKGHPSKDIRISWTD